MDPALLDECLATARDAVFTAGKRIKEMREHVEIRTRKPDGDLATSADLEAEEIILGALARRFPDHGYISEERGESHADAEYTWIVDPIDGTKYYAGNVPMYAVSLALRRRGELVVGAVYAPEFDALYAAASGRGSTLNGQAIHCSTVSDLAHATVCMEIPNRRSSPEDQSAGLQRFAAIVREFYRVRIIGVGSLGLCFCAAGGFDALLNLRGQLDPIDYSGGWVVAREAGAQISLHGTGRWLLAGPAEICNSIREIADL